MGDLGSHWNLAESLPHEICASELGTCCMGFALSSLAKIPKFVSFFECAQGQARLAWQQLRNSTRTLRRFVGTCRSWRTSSRSVTCICWISDIVKHTLFVVHAHVGRREKGQYRNVACCCRIVALFVLSMQIDGIYERTWILAWRMTTTQVTDTVIAAGMMIKEAWRLSHSCVAAVVSHANFMTPKRLTMSISCGCAISILSSLNRQ